MIKHVTSPLPRAAVRGAALGVMFMGLFGTLWAGIGIGGLQERGASWQWIVAVLVGILMLSAGIYLLVRSRHQAATQITDRDARHWKRASIWFGIIFTVEGMSIGAASAICNATEHLDYLFPIMAIIVGVHFIPLAPLFQVKSHYWTGTLMSLLAIGTLLFVPARSLVEGQTLIVWWLVVGFGSALILWGTGLLIWFKGQSWLQS